MENERKAGAGRAVEEADRDIDRHGSDPDTIAERARDTGQSIADTGPELARHIARDNPGTGADDEDMEENDTSMDEDDEDEDDDLEEEDDDDAGVEAEDDDRGNTPI